MINKLAALLMMYSMVLMPNLAHAQMRDPTQPPIATEQTEEGGKTVFKLNSIVIGKHRRIATINDQFVSVGDRIAGAKVVSIRANRVTLLIGGKVLQLYLVGNEVKKR